jgi:hypothetical protein
VQEFDMLFSLADFRAKRILLEERGLMGLSRFTCTDEMRIKPAILFTRGHFKVLADGRTPDAKKQRTFVPSAVSLSFPGFTLMLTIGLDGQKLAPMLIGQSRREVKHNIPTSAQIRDELKSFGLSLPEIPIVLCHSPSTWNNSQIHIDIHALRCPAKSAKVPSP